MIGEPSNSQPGNSHLKILYVEDHSDTRELLCKLLVRDGYDVATADSCLTAIQQARLREFDLVLCDVGLPDGSGLDLLPKLRTLGPIQGIVLSGYGEELDLDAARAAGYAKHLLKPIDYRRVREAIDSIESTLRGGGLDAETSATSRLRAL